MILGPICFRISARRAPLHALLLPVVGGGPRGAPLLPVGEGVAPGPVDAERLAELLRVLVEVPAEQLVQGPFELQDFTLQSKTF